MQHSGKTRFITGYTTISMSKVHSSKPADSAISQTTPICSRIAVATLVVDPHPFMYIPVITDLRKVQLPASFRHPYYSE